MKYTRMDDGSIVFPKRGDPPLEVPNYTRDPKDPYKFTPSFIPCMHRIALTKILPCGKLSYGGWQCAYKGAIVSVTICKECDVEPKI